VQALLFGKLEGLSEETLFLFARTGLVHLFSASGFHLWAAVLVANQASRVFHPFVAAGRERGVLELACRLALMVFFGNATDWSSPMVRAFVFASLLSGAELLERRPDRHWVFLLSLVCAAVLGKGSPLSFLLSAAGMAGVLYIEPRKTWAIALGPALFTLPITLLCFGLFPPLSPLWNLSFGLAISWLVLPPAIVSLVLGSLGLPTAWLDAFAATLMERLTLWLGIAADEAGCVFWVRPAPWLFLTAALYGAWLLRKKKRRLAWGLAGVALVAARSFPAPAFAQLNVGQGDALLLRTKAGWSLSDVGPPGKNRAAPVSRELESLGVGSVQDIALSHFDLDHRGGLASLLIRHEVKGSIWFPENALTAKGSYDVLLAAERAGAKVRFLTNSKAPPGWSCWLSPFRTGNNLSPLCRVDTVGGKSVLLTGDMSREAEEWYLSALRPFPAADVLKVAHHGSRTSSSARFLEASGAKEALIGVGKNRYGHPTREALERLRNSGMSVRRTDREGTVTTYDYSFFSFLTEESARVALPPSRVNPGMPAATSRVYAWPASVE